MEYAKIKKIANEVYNTLEPYCERIIIAGSIRRQKLNPNDIEIVCIPKTIEVPDNSDLFGEIKLIKRHPKFIETVESFEKIKGSAEGKYTQRLLTEGVKLDLFMADENNWGYILAIRTGSDHFSHNTLANGWVREGFKGIGGYLTKNGKVVPVKEERDLFLLLGIPYVDPEHRL